MNITKEIFGKLADGSEVLAYTMDNDCGLKAVILNYGGIIKNLFIKATDGNEYDVVLGRDSFEEYLDNNGYYGALIGRHSNRILNSEFELDGVTYKLAANDGRNNLHGGIKGFDSKLWDSAELIEDDKVSLVLTTVSEDNEEGFPGNVAVKVTYTVTKENELMIHYEALSDKKTVINLTNHSYFNLNGHESGTVDNHKLWIDADFYTPNTDECLPYGEILCVKDTPFDFTTPTTMNPNYNSDYEQVKMFGGIDHNYVLNGKGYRKSAEFIGDKTNIAMEMYTDKPAVQLYTGNAIDEQRVCKNGVKYQKHQAICLETQYFPNSLAIAHFESAIYDAGEKYDFTTTYKFIAK